MAHWLKSANLAKNGASGGFGLKRAQRQYIRPWLVSHTCRQETFGRLGELAKRAMRQSEKHLWW